MTCIEETNDKIISLKDKHSRCKACFKNPKAIKIKKIRIDGCLINTGCRCDFKLVIRENEAYYIELKGTKISKACEQIIATIDLTGSGEKIRFAIVVATACPPFINTKIQRLKNHFKRNYSATLTIKNTYYETSIN